MDADVGGDDRQYLIAGDHDFQRLEARQLVYTMDFAQVPVAKCLETRSIRHYLKRHIHDLQRKAVLDYLDRQHFWPVPVPYPGRASK